MNLDGSNGARLLNLVETKFEPSETLFYRHFVVETSKIAWIKARFARSREPCEILEFENRGRFLMGLV